MRASADSPSKTLQLTVLLLLLAGGLVFRTVFAEAVMKPPARMQGETTQAYRYASMVSSGEGIPGTDTLVMYPRGLRTGENSIFEEYIAGGLHRIIQGDFNGFIRFFSRFFPLLTIPVLFFWLRGNRFTSVESFTASALYAVILPALLRTRGESLYRETVALPLLFAAMAAADLSMGKAGKNQLRYSIAGAVLFFAALAAWKVTGFLAVFLFLWLAFRKAPPGVSIPFAAAQLAGALLLSHMRADGAILSPGVFLAMAAVLSSYFRRPWLFTAAGLILSAAAMSFFLNGSTNHVTSVIAAKIRFMFTHPEDPRLLTPDARLFWVSGYTSPSPGQILLLFGVPLAAAAAGFGRFRKRCGNSLLFWFFPVSLAGYLFFDRLHVLLALAVIPPVVASLGGNRIALAACVAVFGSLSMQAPAAVSILSSTGLEFEDTGSLLSDRELDGLLDWYSHNNAPTLCYWHLSGLLSAYAETPVVTHTFFENMDNRMTIQRFATLMYGDEEGMTEFMEQHGATLLVYQADFVFDRSSSGLLYLAGLREVPDGSLAVRLHYFPESLDRLHPVWQGRSLRVYELDGETSPDLERHVLWEREYGTFLNTRPVVLSSVQSPVETGIYLADNGFSSSSPHMVSAALLLFAGSPDEVPSDASIELLQFLLMAHLQGSYPLERLVNDFETYLNAWGPDPALRLDLIRLLESGGMNDRALEHRAVLGGSEGSNS